MKILVVKLTSMGDALHLLPALSDLRQHDSKIEIDWMIEESFAEIPLWHPAVNRVIPVATRRWRKFRWSALREFIQFFKSLRSSRYDAVIDAQGLIKSAVFARFAKLNNQGQRIGFSADSIKEKPAAKLYRKRIPVARGQHALLRLRQLFGGAFNYSFDADEIDYALDQHRPQKNRSIILLHGTTWASKHLPEQHWHELVRRATAEGYQVLLAWGNAEEKSRAQRLAAGNTEARVLPKSSLSELREHLYKVSGAIAVDTGLGHLAAALGVPCVSIYGATDAQLTGTVGERQIQLQTPFECSPCLLKECDKLNATDDGPAEPPCYAEVSPDEIWLTLHAEISAENTA